MASKDIGKMTITINANCFIEHLDIVNKYASEEDKELLRLYLLNNDPHLVEDKGVFYMYVPELLHELHDKYINKKDKG
jgi:hypothetical protein